MRAWLHARRAATVAAARKLLRRPGRSVAVHAEAAVASATAFGAMAVGMRGPFTPQPGQSVEDQIAELGALVSRLREDLITLDREHRQAIDTLRQQTDEKLRAEQQRADEALHVVRGDLDGLRETTTGGLRLQIEGVLGVVVGVFLTTWPDAVARWLPTWPPFRVGGVPRLLLRLPAGLLGLGEARRCAGGRSGHCSGTDAGVSVSRPRRGKDHPPRACAVAQFVSGVFPPGQKQTSDTTGTPPARGDLTKADHPAVLSARCARVARPVPPPPLELAFACPRDRRPLQGCPGGRTPSCSHTAQPDRRACSA